MRASPFAASLLVSLRSNGWRGEDEGFVHLTKYDPTALAEAEIERFLGSVSGGKQEKSQDIWKRVEKFGKDFAAEVKSVTEKSDLGRLREILSKKAEEEEKQVNFIENATSPLPYTTRFYNTHLQAVFCLDYSRLGIFWNVGDRIELENEKAKKLLEEKKIEDVTNQAPYNTLTQSGRSGRIYRLTDVNSKRQERAAALFNALAVLRGGAKQAQFGTDISPKALILAGLTCGNPIFNHLFKDDPEGPEFKVETFKEIVRDYADRIASPVLLGVRAGYLKNEKQVLGLRGWYEVSKVSNDSSSTKLDGPSEKRGERGNWVEIRVITPIEASRTMGDLLA